MNPLPLFLMALLTACAAQQEPADSASAATPSASEGIRGVVRIVGSAPVNVQVVLQPVEGQALRLVGPLVPELQRLAGVEVTVRGAISPSPDPIVDRNLAATGYDVLAIDGRPVVVGEIISISGGSARLRTESGSEIVLSGAPREFRVGQKVWVQGPESLAVQSYGTIRP